MIDEMEEKYLEPSAKVLTTRQVCLLDCPDEDGGGFKFIYDKDTKITTMHIFKPNDMERVKFERKCVQMSRAFNWTDVKVRRVDVERNKDKEDF